MRLKASEICDQAGVWIVFLAVIFMTGCQGSILRPRTTISVFKPPTPIPSALPVINATVDFPQETIEISIRPTPTAVCSNNLQFLEDITIPDGSSVSPQQVLDKRWLVKNNGSCNWNASYSIELIAGSELSGNTAQSLYPARSDQEAVIRIFFTAPVEAGVYRSAWQAFDPDRTPFGDPIYIEFIVADE